MSKKVLREWKFRICDMIIAIDSILEYTNTHDEKTFVLDLKTRQAVERNFEILGEASKHIPKEIQRETPDIEWFKIYGMRNIIAHDYDDITPQILWKTIQKDISPLKTALINVTKKYNIICGGDNG